MKIRHVIFIGLLAWLAYHLFIVDPHIGFHIKILNYFIIAALRWCGVREPQSPEDVIPFDRNWIERITNLTKAEPQEDWNNGFRSEDFFVVMENRERVMVRIYEPQHEAGKKLPVLVWIHGGGYALNHVYDGRVDGLCQIWCKSVPIYVVSVEYRLAPENPFPAALEDCFTVLLWLQTQQHAKLKDASLQHVFVGGDSAGGNLAVGSTLLYQERVLLHNKADNAPALRPLGLVLFYPGLFTRPILYNDTDFSDAYILPKTLRRWFYHSYFKGNYSLFNDPRAAPLKSKLLHHLPPGVVAAAIYDPLLEDGRALSRALQEHGISLPVYEYPTVHGFLTLSLTSTHSTHAISQCLTFITKRVSEVTL